MAILRPVSDVDRLYEWYSERAASCADLPEHVPDGEIVDGVVDAVVANVCVAPPPRHIWKRKPWVRSRFSRDSVQRARA